MDWTTVFPEGTYTAEEVAAKLEPLKLADLSTGEYVHKDKLDKAIEARKAAQAELETMKSQLDGDEGLKTQVELLTKKLDEAEHKAANAYSELTRTQRIAMAEARTGSDKLARLAVMDAEAIVSDDMDFEEALEKVLTSDPDYTAHANPAPPTTKVTTGNETQGSAAVSKEQAAVNSFAEAAGIKI
jgi:hypothetical protein